MRGYALRNPFFRCLHTEKAKPLPARPGRDAARPSSALSFAKNAEHHAVRQLFPCRRPGASGREIARINIRMGYRRKSGACRKIRTRQQRAAPPRRAVAAGAGGRGQEIRRAGRGGPEPQGNISRTASARAHRLRRKGASPQDEKRPDTKTAPAAHSRLPGAGPGRTPHAAGATARR